MNWTPHWQKQSQYANEAENRKQRISNKGWQPWFAWRPVTANYSKTTMYFASERKVWLERIERRLVQTAWGWEYEYHIDKPEVTTVVNSIAQKARKS
jgi:hypothetical protein